MNAGEEMKIKKLITELDRGLLAWDTDPQEARRLVAGVRLQLSRDQDDRTQRKQRSRCAGGHVTAQSSFYSFSNTTLEENKLQVVREYRDKLQEDYKNLRQDHNYVAPTKEISIQDNKAINTLIKISNGDLEETRNRWRVGLTHSPGYLHIDYIYELVPRWGRFAGAECYAINGGAM